MEKTLDRRLGEVAFLQARHANKGGQPSCSAHESCGGLGEGSENPNEKTEGTSLARLLHPYPLNQYCGAMASPAGM